MIKLIESTYDDSGMSYVNLQTDLGNFCGYAFLADEDKDYESQFFGCELAEARALIDYYTEKRRRLSEGLEVLYRLQTDFNRNKCFSESIEYSILNKRIRQKEEQKRVYDKELALLHDFDKNRPEDRINIIENNKKIIEKVNEKRQENK